jgi:carbamoyltransferase
MPEPVRVLGLSAYYHDSAACLVVDGRIVAAAQEERFTRKKHDAAFPSHAVGYCLKEAGLTIDEIDIAGFYEKPLVKFGRLLESYLAVAPRGLHSYLMAMPQWLSSKLWLADGIRRELGREDITLLFGDHHESHAASAFYPSPFEEAAILTMDGVGEWATSSIGVGRGSTIDMLQQQRFPHSVGLLYSAFTYFTGFRVNSGEYKVMGLAPYGEPRFVPAIRDHIVDIHADGSIKLNLEYFEFVHGLTMTGPGFEKLFGGPARKAEAPLTQRELDLARSIQDVTEEIMLRMARTAFDLTGLKNLCMAGGVALNCVGNGRIEREGPFDEIWIQPAAGDAGGALGVALSISHKRAGIARFSAERSGAWRPSSTSTAAGSGLSGSGTPVASGFSRNVDRREVPPFADAMQGTLLGPAFSDDEIAQWIDESASIAERVPRPALAQRVARMLADGLVVGLVQGRMEFGPRALGARSILGDARSPTMQSVMNLKIKFRESFRPFAPAVLREHVAEWFELDRDSPYMLLVADVVKSQRIEMTAEQQALWGIEKLHVPRSGIPAVTHVDYSARVQTVRRDANPLFHDIIKAFYDLTGCPVIVNTSFNVRGEPIVCTPEDAYRCFMRTAMDALVIESFVLLKNLQAVTEDSTAWQQEFALD